MLVYIYIYMYAYICILYYTPVYLYMKATNITSMSFLSVVTASALPGSATQHFGDEAEPLLVEGT